MHLALWLCLAAVLVLALVLGTAASRRRERVRQRRRNAERFDSMTPRDAANSIFVIMPCLADERACADTLFDLFDQARCPWRVTVGIVHHGAPSAVFHDMHEDVVGLYGAQCAARQTVDFSDRVKQAWHPISEAAGPSAARSEAWRDMFARERYIMTVDSHTRFEPGWDDLLLAQYGRCRAAQPVLTTFPPEFDADMGVVLHQGATFPRAIASADGSFGTLAPAVFQATPAAPTPVWFFCSKLSFAASAAWVQCPPSAAPNIAPAESDLLHGARLWCAGWDMFAPTCLIVRHGRRHMRHSDRAADIGTARRIAAQAVPQSVWTDVQGLRTLSAYIAGSGVDPHGRRVMPHALHGLTGPDATAAERAQRHDPNA